MMKFPYTHLLVWVADELTARDRDTSGTLSRVKVPKHLSALAFARKVDAEGGDVEDADTGKMERVCRGHGVTICYRSGRVKEVRS